LDASRKEIAAKAATMNTELQNSNKQLPVHQTALKTAQETLTTKEAALAEPKSIFEEAQARQATLEGDLKFWRAAEVNAQVLVATEKRDSLKSAQEEETVAADTIANQLESFRGELGKIESRKEELTSQLDKLGKEVATLKKSLEERKPLLEESERETKALLDRYQELLK
ncbi:MAG: hypothetical protein VX633_11150, partial [Verrucomicrobiota bacterium]|nr:hypothetical protein [Verrucomicrobiota bacterium]